MPGPARTPLAILKARGSNRVASRKNEPQPPATMPVCPKHLDKVARAEWKRMAALLHPMGLLTSIDGTQLAIYCQNYSRWVDAEKQLATDGAIVKSPNGYPIQHPALAVSNSAVKIINRCLTAFGMNPADRSRVSATKPTTTDKSKFFPEYKSPLRIAE